MMFGLLLRLGLKGGLCWHSGPLTDRRSVDHFGAGCGRRGGACVIDWCAAGEVAGAILALVSSPLLTGRGAVLSLASALLLRPAFSLASSFAALVDGFAFPFVNLGAAPVLVRRLLALSFAFALTLLGMAFL